TPQRKGEQACFPSSVSSFHYFLLGRVATLDKIVESVWGYWAGEARPIPPIYPITTIILREPEISI
ncbi:MAG: hypothetical protein WC832_08835, partial [Anaerolineales bacterium]